MEVWKTMYLPEDTFTALNFYPIFYLLKKESEVFQNNLKTNNKITTESPSFNMQSSTSSQLLVDFKEN